MGNSSSLNQAQSNVCVLFHSEDVQAWPCQTKLCSKHIQESGAYFFGPLDHFAAYPLRLGCLTRRKPNTFYLFEGKEEV